jgi:hypothetical protein
MAKFSFYIGIACLGFFIVVGGVFSHALGYGTLYPEMKLMYLPMVILGLLLGIAGRNSTNKKFAIAGIWLCAPQIILVAALYV